MGRDVPGVGGELAAAWIANRFSEIGLVPAFGDSSFTQEFPLLAAVLDTENTWLQIAAPSWSIELKWGDGFFIFPRRPVSFDTTFSGVYAGYGISAPELNRMDYSDDTKDKAAFVHEGAGDLPPHRAGKHALAPFKAAAAERAGTGMLVIMTPSEKGDQFPPENLVDKIENSHKELPDLPGAVPDFPVVFINGGKLHTKAGISQSIEKLLSSHFLAAQQADDLVVRLSVVFRDYRECHGLNVSGKIKGLTDEFVLLGAHYDHLGKAGLDQNGNPVFYPGADDNASGVTGMLEICRGWSEETNLDRGLLVVAFGAEEDGLIGSRYFADNLPVNRGQIKAMLNLDMIGREGFATMSDAHTPGKKPDPDFAVAYYSGAAPRLHELIRDAGHQVALNLEIRPVNRFPFSDAGSFHSAAIPTIHLFSGFHSQYSGIDDTVETISFIKLSKMVLLARHLMINLSQEPGDIEFDPSIIIQHSGMKY